MCISWLKKLFVKGEPVLGSGNTEHVSDTETGTTVAPIDPETGSDENTNTENNNVAEPIIIAKKKYEGVNFHVLLDNGHASSTPGKRQQLDNGQYFYEYLFNRQVVQKIARKLDELGIPFEILVPEVDKDISLTERAARANSFCTKYGTDNCFFISVHSNAYGDGKTFTSAKGWSVWTTKAQTKSDRYATIVFEEAEKILPKYNMTTRSQMTDGDPDYEENFTVIYKTWCPAILTENLFFTNKEEVMWLMTDEGQEAIADIHVKAIERIIKERK
jgi:N-acetylmuramoyl-L-alanine amidase